MILQKIQAAILSSIVSLDREHMRRRRIGERDGGKRGGRGPTENQVRHGLQSLVHMFLQAPRPVGVGQAIAESISCLLPEMAVAMPKILHSTIFGI